MSLFIAREQLLTLQTSRDRRYITVHQRSITQNMQLQLI